jgi:hypothetical protein
VKSYVVVTALLAAEEVARNTGDVKDVRNQLVVRKAL